MINIDEFVENSKKIGANGTNSFDITEPLLNVIKNYEENLEKRVQESLSKVLDKDLEESSKIYEKALKSNINVIENFLQDLDKINIMSSWGDVDLNEIKPTTNFIDRKNEVVEILKLLPSDIQGTYINKVTNALKDFNEEFLNKKEQEHNYDFER